MSRRLAVADKGPYAGLTVGEAKFVREYITNGNNARAAMTVAGYRKDQHPIIGRPHIKDAILRHFRDWAQEQKLTPADIIGELAMIAFAPITDTRIPIKDKMRALELLGKHLGLFTDKIDLTLRKRWEVEVSLDRLSDSELAHLEVTAHKTQLKTEPTRTVTLPPRRTNGSNVPPGS